MTLKISLRTNFNRYFRKSQFGLNDLDLSYITRTESICAACVIWVENHPSFSAPRTSRAITHPKFKEFDLMISKNTQSKWKIISVAVISITIAVTIAGVFLTRKTPLRNLFATQKKLAHLHELQDLLENNEPPLKQLAGQREISANKFPFLRTKWYHGSEAVDGSYLEWNSGSLILKHVEFNFSRILLDQRSLKHPISKQFITDLSVSNDLKFLVFRAGKTSYLYGIGSGDVVELTAFQTLPSPPLGKVLWSPKGSNLAFIQNGSIIVNINADTSHIIANHSVDHENALGSFSPDGYSLVFIDTDFEHVKAYPMTYYKISDTENPYPELKLQK